MKKNLFRIFSLLLAAVILAACSTPDMHGRVPTEKDEIIVSEDEKNGIVAEGMLGAAGAKVSTYEGFLGYGYNLLEAAYYNQDDIKASNPIIDTDALAAAGYVYVNANTANSINLSTFISDTTKEYSIAISAAANLKGRVGLTGSFKASFEMDYNSEIKSNQKLITTQSRLYTRRDFIYGATNSELAEFVTREFKSDAKDKSPEELISKYGSHILKDIYLGGRFELNYLYTNTSGVTTEAIRASVSASNGWVSGSASGSTDTRRKEVEENSKLLIRAYGGSVTVDPNSIEKARESYAAWAQGVENGKINFVDCTEIIPLWEVIANMDFEGAKDKAKEVDQYFNSKSDQIAAEFKASISVKTYIASLHIGTGNTATIAKNVLRQEGVLEGNIINLDLNRNAGGDFIYLGYKTTTDSSKAIRGICANYFSSANSSDITYKNSNYKIIATDLNKGAGGKYIYLYYTTDENAGDPITGIQYQDDETFQYKNADNYEVVRCTTNGSGMDLNMSVGGDYIYLWFTRK